MYSKHSKHSKAARSKQSVHDRANAEGNRALTRRRRGEEAIEPFAQRREERRRRGEGGNFQSRKRSKGVGKILCARPKEGNPDLRTQEARSDFQSSHRVSDPKRAERGNSSNIGRKGSLFTLLEEACQGAEGTLSVIQLGSHRVGGSNDPAVSGAGEVKEKLHPRCPPIEGVHLLGPR
jgi:hypothetical protein